MWLQKVCNTVNHLNDMNDFVIPILQQANKRIISSAIKYGVNII